MYATHAPAIGMSMLPPETTEDPREALAAAVWLLTDLAVACTRDTDPEDRRLVLQAADELCRGWGLDG